jgi:hypothetical protein
MNARVLLLVPLTVASPDWICFSDTVLPGV